MGWVLPKLCSTEALTSTQYGKDELPPTGAEGGSERVPWLVGWLGLLRVEGVWQVGTEVAAGQRKAVGWVMAPGSQSGGDRG